MPNVSLWGMNQPGVYSGPPSSAPGISGGDGGNEMGSSGRKSMDIMKLLELFSRMQNTQKQGNSSGAKPGRGTSSGDEAGPI